jgi:uncharacterized membrane protein
LAKSKSNGSKSSRRGPSELKLLGRLWTLHARLFISVAFGVAFALTLTALPWRMPTRLIVGWDLGVALYLILSGRAAARATIATMRQRAAINDDGAIALLVLATAAALASLAAVLAELGHAPGWYQVTLGVGTILLSWAFMHWIFALHYAHEFYGAGGDKRSGGLVFPGNQEPDYWDFLYYSLVVAMTAQVSDVQVTSKTIRRLTTVHGVVSFFFNVAVLALTVNIVSGLMQLH